ncbi:putative peptidoglycan biosynthesis protein MurJ [Caloramator mitchellensis]|uniref:Probable lipid II flippase MurJ n=1 Tax=Caloramator mitchellensis TaxID=908809 RepID=A0A0R3K2B6_CALMK|nr:murein biosynthesis integral membrane protein MurJ [Caloramator mitchellensis]KRQ87436.1 putative peptidoglycan biosynthesis protein MurJ [Caloramator mitchellensis]
MKGVNLAKAAGIVMFITIMSKVLGFFRTMLLASSFGTTMQSDAYVVSLTIPLIIYSVIGAAVNTTFIPILSRSLTQRGKEDMIQFANNIMNILFLISIIIFGVGFLLSPQIVRVIAHGFSGEKFNLTVALTRISMFNVLALSMTAGFMSILQSLNEFKAPAMVGIALDLPIILYLILGAKYGIYGLSVATLIGYTMQFVIQIPYLLKHDYKYKFFIDLKDTRVKEMLYLILPILIGTTVNQINSIVDKTMASSLPNGNISAYNFAINVNSMLYGVFVASIIMVIYPAISREGANKAYDNMKVFIHKGITSILLIMVPAAVGLFVLRYDVLTIFFKRGLFNEDSVNLTAYALAFLLLGLPFYGVRDIFNRAFYGLNDTKTPMINGIFGVALNITLNLLFVRYLGIGGLALATSMSAILTSILLGMALSRRINGVQGRKILIALLKISLSAFMMGFAVKGVEIGLKFIFTGLIGMVLTLGIAVLTGIFVYFISLIVLKLEELDDALNMILKRKRAK